MSKPAPPTASASASMGPVVDIPNILHVEVLRGAEADDGATPEFLVEVPHGADETHHYEFLRAQLKGPLPSGLADFFHLNTDVGAWAIGRRTAELLVKLRPTTTCLLLRCLVPRTFVDCNRPSDYEGGSLTAGGLTAGIPVYIHDDDDRALLLQRHRAYVEATHTAYEWVCGPSADGGGGIALIPHTYGPRSLGVDRVDDDIVNKLHWACEPERHDTWPLRAEVDLLTRDDKDTLVVDERMETDLRSAFEAAGYAVVVNDTYSVHPASLAHTFCTTYPGQCIPFEVRRDLVVDAWTPFAEMTPNRPKVDRVATVLAPFVQRLLR